MNFVFKDGKIEAEDFTSRLYRELNSSPQPYLVPFLKVIRSPLRVPSVAGGGRRAPLGRGGLGQVSPVCLQLSSPQDRLLSFLFGGFSISFETLHCCDHNVVLHLGVQKGPVLLEGGPCAGG